MKTKFFTFFLVVLMASAIFSKAQIIITGFIANPNGGDGNREYVQLMATQDIYFSNTNYSLIVYYGHSTDAKPHALGWVQGGIVTNSSGYTTTYKFNLTSGTAAKGTFFYVGGTSNLIGSSGTLDISSANWIRKIKYDANPGDDGVGTQTEGLFTNGSSINGISVFSGTAIDQNTVPIDVVFFGGALEADVPGRFYQAGPPELGYKICNNDLYSLANGGLFWNIGNQSYLQHSNIGSNYHFTKLGGVYDVGTNQWVTARAASPVNTSSATSIDVIQTGSGITQLINTLPVNLVSFKGQVLVKTVKLNWTTASEQNNSHFEILRANGNGNFEVIGTRQGNGTTNEKHDYIYTDYNPLAGTSYYKLRQVDVNGTSIETYPIVVEMGLVTKGLNILANVTDNQLNVYANSTGSTTATLTLTSVSGQKLLQQKINLVRGANAQQVTTDNLPNGVYLISLSTAKERAVVKVKK